MIPSSANSGSKGQTAMNSHKKMAILEAIEEQYRKKSEAAEAKLNGELQEELHVAKVRHDLNLTQLDKVYQSEVTSLKQSLEEGRVLLYESMKHDIETRIRNLEKDYRQGRCNEALPDHESLETRSLSESSSTSLMSEPGPEPAGVSSERVSRPATSELKQCKGNSEGQSPRGKKIGQNKKSAPGNEKPEPPRKLKRVGRGPVSTRNPYIVYNLLPEEIVDDCAEIAFGLKEQEAKEKIAFGSIEQEAKDKKVGCAQVTAVGKDGLGKATGKDRKRPYKAEFDASHQLLHYDGQVYRTGSLIEVVHCDGSTVEAKIKSMKEDAYIVCSTTTGSKCKLFIKQLQRGKYKIKHIAGLQFAFAM